MKSWSTGCWALGVVGLIGAARPGTTNAAEAGPDRWLETLEWRSIGPAAMGGRITDLAVYEADPRLWWAATASGGLLKTTNDGISFEHQFDREATVSIGDVAVAQSDPDIVWVGTGESNPRNSVSWGNGVYKSADGGATWTHLGLDGTFQIGRIVIHPEDPDVVYVGALGRLWGPNEERGLFRTTDGGATWEKVLYVDEHTGVVDVAMSPSEPGTLLVATWERQRDGFDTNDPAKKWGPGSALYRTTDGGDTFERVTEGLPSGNLGRIGLDWYRAEANTVYAIIESERIGKQPENAAYAGLRGEDAEVGARLTEVTDDGPAAASGLQSGDIVVRVGDVIVHSYADLLGQVRRHLAGDTIELEVSRNRKSVVLEITFGERPEVDEDVEDEEEPRRRRPRSQTRSPFAARLGGQLGNMQEQQGPDGHEFGGVYRSTDGGVTWERINTVNPRPMYFSQLRVDPSDDDNLYVLGVALHRSRDGGATFTADGGRGVHPDHHAMWIDPEDGRHIILGNDGGLYVTHDRMARWDHLNHVAIGQFYHVTVDPRPSYRIYGGLQDNGSWGGPVRSRHGAGTVNEDWFRVGGGDGFVCRVDAEDPDEVYFESQNGGMGRRNLRTGDRGFVRPRGERGTRYRFNWKTPFVLSHHNSRIHYAAGNHVFRSLNRGTKHKAISPDITRTDRGSATALAESPLDADVLYVGTDDGALWMTLDGGATWIDLYASIAPAAADAEETAPSTADPASTPRAPAAPPPLADAARLSLDFQRRPRATAHRRSVAGTDQLSYRTVRGRTVWTNVRTGESGLLRRGRGFPSGVNLAPTPKTPDETADETPDPAAKSTPETPATADPVTGTWTGRARGENLPPDGGVFTLALRLTSDGAVRGRLRSDANDGRIEPGTYDAETGRIAFDFRGERWTLSYRARIRGERMTGTVEVGDVWSMEFEATRTSSDAPAGRDADGDAAPDDGHDWKPLSTLMPEPRWVSSLAASRAEPGRVYVTFDGHRSDDDRTYVFVSENHGRTWRSLRANLPEAAGPVRVLREDRENPDLLYLGCEFSAWVSLDRGATWLSLNTNLPTVAVHEFAQHPTCGDLIAGTHGRSLWVLDVTPLRRLAAVDADAGPLLLEPSAARYWRRLPSRGQSSRRFVGANPPGGAHLYYCLPDEASVVSLTVTDLRGKPVRTLEAVGTAGMHRIDWDLRRTSDPREGARGRRRGGPRVEPGTYLVTLTVDDDEFVQPLVVHGDPEYPDAVLWGEAYDELLELDEMIVPDEPGD